MLKPGRVDGTGAVDAVNTPFRPVGYESSEFLHTGKAVLSPFPVSCPLSILLYSNVWTWFIYLAMQDGSELDQFSRGKFEPNLHLMVLSFRHLSHKNAPLQTKSSNNIAQPRGAPTHESNCNLKVRLQDKST